MQDLDDDWVMHLEDDDPVAALREAAGWPELPEVIPAWVLDEIDVKDTGCRCAEAARVGEPVAAVWAIPGVTGLGNPSPATVLPPVSSVMVELDRVLRVLETVDPRELAGVQALVDAQAGLAAEQRLHVLNLRCTGDVKARGLHELAGFRSASTWLRQHRPDGDASDARLASALHTLPVLRAAVEDGLVPLASAKKVAASLRQIGPHLDRVDGLIDGQPGDEVLEAVVGHVTTLVCRDLQGLAEDDPRLAALIGRARAILDEGGSQVAAMEAALTWLAEELPARRLSAPLDELVCALLPSVLDEREADGHAWRSLTLTPRPDGKGYRLEGDLDLETGEMIWVALRAEVQRDPDNPEDTEAWAAARKAAGEEAREQVQDAHGLGLQHLPRPGDDAAVLPRARKQRLHDAFRLLLRRYLDADLAGTVGKNPVHINVTLPEGVLAGRPGAAPARTASGRLIPTRVVRRWWCDASVTGFVLGLGGRALRVVHRQRTITGIERKALDLEGGGVCAGDGCCSSRPDLFVRLVPHHVLGWAENLFTSLDESLMVCDALHRAVHDGLVVRLKDGRYLAEEGFLDEAAALARMLAPAPF